MQGQDREYQPEQQSAEKSRKLDGTLSAGQFYMKTPDNVEAHPRAARGRARPFATASLRLVGDEVREEVRQNPEQRQP